ncbi:MAG: carbohydrate ABC transporter permease [Deinococcota bacterium]
MKRQKWINSILLHVIMIPAAVLFLLPIFWMLISATKADNQILSATLSFLPGTSLADNWLELSDDLPFLRSVFNSVGIAVLYTILATLISAMGGYALAKFQFVGRKYLFALIVATLTVPYAVLAIPQFILVARELRMSNTWWAVMLPGLANALGIFFMRQNMLSVPSELLEAARIDGASEVGIFARIVLPVVKPALAAVGIILFLFQWNSFFWPLLVLPDKNAYTIPVALGTLVGLTRVSWGGIMLGTAISTLPFLVMFLFLQRYFIAGITVGATKG